ncbi:unnamed protein product [Auanema sp. JU1783]|nr:unnamed protein product [Auanema sp. JU1783]
MLRLTVLPKLARGYASAAPKFSTGIEHAETMKKAGGGKPDWALYKCDDYLKMNKYSYYDSEITMAKDRVPQPTNKKPDVLPKTNYSTMSLEEESSIRQLFSANDETIISVFKSFVSKHSDEKDFSHLDYFARKALSDLIQFLYETRRGNAVVAAEILNALRLIARDKNHLEVIFSHDGVGDFVVFWTFDHPLPSPLPNEIPVGLIEALSCLVNASFHSQTMLQLLSAYPQERIFKRFNELATAVETKAVYRKPLIMMIRILFLITAQSQSIRKTWCTQEFHSGSVEHVLQYFKKTKLQKFDKEDGDLFVEYSKFLFNLISKTPTTKEKEAELIDTFRTIVCSAAGNDHEVVQQMCNLCTVLGVFENNLTIPQEESSLIKKEVFGGFEMTPIKRAIQLLEQQIDSSDFDQAGVVITFLLLYCVASANIRRYARLQILPPLREIDVTRRPEEGETMRNKLVRLMMNVHNINQLASELMFVLCKRSVPRMIKYTGFGHSAGLLANSGLLGLINSKQSDENSEDSETEDYAAVEDKINPVTGHIKEDIPLVFDDMTEEQKEYESMKLVEAMNKLMDAGVIKPGTVGDDGKVRAVNHILELTKNIKLDNSGTDSDSD